MRVCVAAEALRQVTVPAAESHRSPCFSLFRRTLGSGVGVGGGLAGGGSGGGGGGGSK